MSKDANARFKELFDRLQNLRLEPPHVFSSSLEEFQATPEYQELLALGPRILAACIGKLREGAWFLNKAALDLLGISVEEILPGAEFPSEQEVATALVSYWDSAVLTLVWTAETLPDREVTTESSTIGQTTTQAVRSDTAATAPEWAA